MWLRSDIPLFFDGQAGCPVCGSQELRDTVSVRDWRLGTPGEYILRRCRRCGLAWLVEPAGVSSLLPVELAPAPVHVGWRRWLKRAGMSSRLGYPPPSHPWLARWLGAVVGRVFAGRLSYLPPYVHEGHLLDVGCGAGQYVRAMRDLGWTAFGLEPALAGASAEVEGICPFAAGRAEQMPFAPQQFDIITLWHSLEHTMSPAAALVEARRLLRSGGRLMLEVPNLDSQQARLFGRYWVHLDVPRHRFHFTPAALRRALQNAGFIDVSIRLRPSAVGWEGSIRNWTSARGKCLPALRWPLRVLAHLAAGLERIWGNDGCIWVSARPAPAPRVLDGTVRLPAPKLSVIIVTWNCRQALEQCLESLRPALVGIPAEIIIADNGSSDGTVEWLCRQVPEARVLAFPENLGFAVAANRAAGHAGGEFLWFLNPDTMVEAEAPANLLTALEKNPGIGAAGPQLLTPAGRPYILSARCFPTLWTELLEKAGLQGLSFSRLAVTPGDETAEVPAVSGAALCVRRRAWEEIGGFDERYFLYAEDIDLCRALRAAGWKIYYVGRAKVRHWGGLSSARCVDDAGIQALVSLQRYFCKHSGRLAGHAYRGMISLLSLIKMAIFGMGMVFVPRVRGRAVLHRRVLNALWKESVVQ